MKKAPHTIHKVSAEISVPGNRRDQVNSESFKNSVEVALKRLTTYWDETFSDEYYRADKVEISLNIRLKELDNLDNLLAKKLKEKIKAVSYSPANEEKVDSIFKRVASQKHQEELLIYFLKSGGFPWWAQTNAFEEVEKFLREISAKTWRHLMKPLGSDSEVWNRLVLQFPKDLLNELIEKSTQSKKKAEEAHILLQKSIKSKESNNDSRVGTKSVAGAYVTIIKKLIIGQSLSGQSRKISEVEKLNTIKNKYQDKPVSDNKEEKKLRKEISFSEKENSPNSQDGNVWNAGLILLHPFLADLFQNLSWVKEKKFLNEETREKAVCLLHFLATGEEQFPENELLLPKILCVQSPNKTVNRFLTLEEREKEEGLAVLESVCQHWKALINTSVEGLQVNFLQRKGILKKEEFGQVLYVERETWDILLDQLPWNLSVFKLPWMNRILTVNW